MTKIILLFVVSVIVVGGIYYKFGSGGKVAGQSINDTFTNDLDASMVKAAARGDMAEAKRLVAEGANPNVIGENDITPLFWMLSSHNKEGLKILLEIGADPTVGKLKGVAPITVAAGIKDSDYLVMMLDAGASPNADTGEPKLESLLHTAVIHRQFNNLKILLDRGADINKVDGIGATPALTAAMISDWETVDYLATRGADLNKADEGGDMTVKSLAEDEVKLIDPNSPGAVFLKKVQEKIKTVE